MGLLAKLHESTEPPLPDGHPSWPNWDDVGNENHGIVELGIERTACFGECPIYSAIIRADGVVEYVGTGYVPRIGRHSGAVGHSFHCLAAFVAGTRFWEFESRYDFKDRMVTDLPSTYVMVATKERRKIVGSYGGTAPPELWAIAELIDKLLSQTDWSDDSTEYEASDTSFELS